MSYFGQPLTTAPKAQTRKNAKTQKRKNAKAQIANESPKTSRRQACLPAC
jgi:hypothetical protein